MHLLLGGALNSYWVMRMDDFYTTHNIKSKGLRQNCQKKSWIPKNSYGRWLWPSKCILQLRKGAEAGGWSDPVQQSYSGLPELLWGQGFYRCRSPKFSVLHS